GAQATGAMCGCLEEGGEEEEEEAATLARPCVTTARATPQRQGGRAGEAGGTGGDCTSATRDGARSPLVHAPPSPAWRSGSATKRTAERAAAELARASAADSSRHTTATAGGPPRRR